MFRCSDFVVVTFENLEHFEYSVLSYTWNDSPWKELVGGLQLVLWPWGMKKVFFWLDIFCLDQFCADKMESIVRSDEIYGWAQKYFGMGLAIFDRVWCLAETACTGDKAQRPKEMIYVHFMNGWNTGCLPRREKAYFMAKLHSNPTFNDSRCTVESDRDIVKARILKSGFASVDEFDASVQKIADKVMWPFKRLGWNALRNNRWHELHRKHYLRVHYTFRTSRGWFFGGDDNKCSRCGKLKEHHHTKKRDGTISEHEWCYDFLLDL